MINIYCLIDPRTNNPFYVGCTNGSLKYRLSGHITEINTYHGIHRSKKQNLIAEIIQAELRPIIILLCVTDMQCADHCEKFYYKALSNAGFNLLQLPKAFFYSKKIESEIYNYQHNMKEIKNNHKINDK